MHIRFISLLSSVAICTVVIMLWPARLFLDQLLDKQNGPCMILVIMAIIIGAVFLQPTEGQPPSSY